MIKWMEQDEDKVPYRIIVRASKGDKEALEMVLNHYSSYIDHYSLRPVKSKNGQELYYVDEDIKHQAQEKLIKQITEKYDITRLPIKPVK